MSVAIVVVIVVIGVLLTIGATAAAASVRVLREYERGVVFRLGRLVPTKGPGLIMLVPTIDRMVRVSLRTVTLTVPPQEVITRDNIPVRVTAVAYYRVVDSTRAITEVENFHAATLQIAQTTLRSVLGGVDLDHLLSERERLNEALQQIIDTQTEPWGIKVTTVEIKDVEIPERMQHAIARQAEAERERRAKIINAEGEFQAAARLAEAGEVIGANPTTLQLRYLQTLREIGVAQNSTVVFPMPIDLVKPVLEAAGSMSAQRSEAAGSVSAGSVSAERSEAAAPEQLGDGAQSELTPGPAEGASAAQLGVGSDDRAPEPAADRQRPDRDDASAAPRNSAEP